MRAVRRSHRACGAAEQFIVANCWRCFPTSLYLSRDTILPRFYRQAQSEFRHALISGEIAAIDETLTELRFLLDVAVKGDGIITVMTHKRAQQLKRRFDRMTAAQALRGFRHRRRLEAYILKRVPMRLLTRVARVLPLYG